MKKVLFLGYDATETPLIGKLEAVGVEVSHERDKIKSIDSDVDLVISQGYRHILSKELLSQRDIPFINLHIAYLPYNRGAHPNFWAFMENTPHGVTIHLIDEGIDTGPILYQKYVNFDKELTFTESYNRLKQEIETLFVDNIENILSGDYIAKPQRGAGTFHTQSDLPEDVTDWNGNVYQVIQSLDEKYSLSVDKKLSLIDEIEKVRTRNNVNWMDLLRLSVKASPSEAKKIISKINSDDNLISELFARLSE
jgi:folate-dependent phosphoribosylglycinamide formyltransferase PurN